MKKLIILLVALVAMNGAMAQWFPLNSGTTNNLNSVYFTDVNTGYAVGEGGTILKTTDGGVNWLFKNSETLFNLKSVFFTSSSTGSIVGDSGTILRTTNSGTNWENINSGTSYTLNSVHFPATDTGYIAGGDDNYSQPQILKTIDGGLTWTIIVTDITLPMNLTSVCFITSNTGYATGHYWTMCAKEIVLKTEDGGIHWTIVYDNSPCDFGTSFKTLFFTDGNHGHVAGHWEGTGQIMRTDDGGLNWSSQLFNYPQTFRSIQFPNNNTGYSVGDFGKILKTNDGGVTWLNQPSETTNDLTSVFFINATIGFVVGENGTILKTTNGGASSGCLPEGITFTTQEEIDNFQVNYPGCTEIEGDVSIEGWNITNLHGLSVLISIGGYLEIYYNNGLTSLTGLENLSSIGGSLDIIDNYALSSLTGLMSLTYLGGDLNTIRDHALISLTGLENLTSIGGDVSIEVNLSLTSLTGLDNLTSIGGKLQIGDYDYGNPALTSLSGLDNLISIGGNMFIGYNPELTDMTALENVTSFQGDVTITGNYSLTNCAIQNICNYLNAPNGVVEIYNNGPGCNSQSEVVSACGGSIPCLPYGNYYLLSQDDVDNFKINFPACNDLAGNLIITGNSIINLTGLNQVYSIGGSACIDYCDNLENLNGLENLYSIGGSLGVHENNQLLSLSGLESLDFIDGLLAIGTIDDGGAPSAPPGGNPLLTSISSLSSLTDVGGLDIGQNPSLLSLSGLDNIDANTLAYVAIGLNSSLSTCEVQSICDYLAAPNAYILISDNAPGCNSPEEVIEACLITVEEVAGVSGILVIPNPAGDMITVSLPMLTGNEQLTLFNITGEKLLERQITNTETQINLSALPRGVYVVRVQDEKMVEVGKIIKE